MFFGIVFQKCCSKTVILTVLDFQHPFFQTYSKLNRILINWDVTLTYRFNFKTAFSMVTIIFCCHSFSIQQGI